MASGKKNYFRHSFNARKDIKLLKLRDEVGIGFYFYYFSLLELCGEESSEDLRKEYVFHPSTIRQLWGKSQTKCEHVASSMNAVGLLFFSKRENDFVFQIDNFPKYLGRYTNKIDPNTPNKRKEKKIKENKTKETSTNSCRQEVVHIVNYLNKKLNTSYKSTTRKTHELVNARLNEGFTVSDFEKVIDSMYIQWNDTDMQKYLRPVTLFSPKFESYLNQPLSARNSALEYINSLNLRVD